jgi:hypothetical protein
LIHCEIEDRDTWRRRKAAIALSFGIFAAALAVPCLAADEAACPETVEVKQTVTASAPGWNVSYATRPHRLEQITFFNGPPSEQASLVYDDWKNAKDAATATWTFPPDARGYFVQCAYSGTSVELSRRLPESIKSCRVIYEKDVASARGLPAIRQIVCR